MARYPHSPFEVTAAERIAYDRLGDAARRLAHAASASVLGEVEIRRAQLQEAAYAAQAAADALRCAAEGAALPLGEVSDG